MAERFSDAALGREWTGPLGDSGVSGTGSALPQLGVAVLNFNDAEATVRCLASLAACQYAAKRILVVDNGSSAADVAILRQNLEGQPDTELRFLGSNTGYAGGNNLALAHLFESGCDYVLVLNSDTIVTPDALTMLVRCARANPSAGPLGPRVAKDWPGSKPASLGERYWGPIAWAPRSILRYRRQRQQSYPVAGVLGCAFLLSRQLYERAGGFDERYFAYYEEVDYCLRARALGMVPRVEPSAEIAHMGHRGFAGGFSRVAAYLKARNLWCLGRNRVRAAGWLLFAPGYFAMLLASTLVYAVRGRFDIVAAMLRGMTAAFEGRSGAPPQALFGAYVPSSTERAAFGGNADRPS